MGCSLDEDRRYPYEEIVEVERQCRISWFYWGFKDKFFISYWDSIFNPSQFSSRTSNSSSTDPTIISATKRRRVELPSLPGKFCLGAGKPQQGHVRSLLKRSRNYYKSVLLPMFHAINENFAFCKCWNRSLIVCVRQAIERSEWASDDPRQKELIQ